ncbi:hypothetical protein DFH07DRAFT_964087 [Mycena maculata]|uniref:Uncharacterized protein n=1 Tax=Mycena maculata TaxID=230809 RepID=A0AAD7IJT4_9AGAR|nr:hypothetical protein DFH07DRAFT_964087 [Mycena maculata]
MASVKAQSVPVFMLIAYGVLGYNLLHNFIFEALYFQYDLFAPLARNLTDLAAENASTMYSAMVAPPFECPDEK